MLKEDNKFDHINVEDPLSPEKGGFLKALMEDYERPKEQFQRYCEYPGFSRIDDLGLELNIPKINVCNKYKFDFPVADYSDGVTRDLRVIPYDIAVQRGLHLKSSLDFEERAAEIMNKDIRVANEVTKTLTTNGLRREENFFLISLDELQDKSLSMVLDHFGREYASAKNAMPVFNDDKYAPAFDRTEKLLNHFEIKLDHSILKDKRPDSGVDTIDKKDEFYRARHYEYKALYDAGHDIMYGTFYKTNPAGKSTVKMPYPINFRSTDDYLKACSHLIADNALETSLQKKDKNPFVKLDKYELSTLKETRWKDVAIYAAGLMIAAQAGIPLTRDDRRRFSEFKIETDINSDNYTRDQIGLKRAFDVAAKVANTVRDIDLTKDQQTEPLNKGLWDFYKQDHENLAIQRHTPTLAFVDSVLDKLQGVKSEDVLKTIDNLVQTRVAAVAENKKDAIDIVYMSKDLRNDLAKVTGRQIDINFYNDISKLSNTLKEQSNSSNTRER
ncbi:hypothetical protein [Anaerobiospirillum sp. NML120511]|uniref:hypothetical protein n=1 Tax=Anaerobiospirillum sp. NML120511 TaxID=2932819 RepID=UPI001FF2C4C7|nr:hypothetical protein [Anaerobiospirillum sp. NML120511]MCK0535733.1 hypothetical protein [Anaerobiospirillum sp. NML120511]